MTLALSLPLVGVMAVGGFALAIGATYLCILIARQLNIVDRPEQAPQRKLQPGAVPLLGGWAIYLVFVLTTALLWDPLTTGYLLPKHLIGIWLAGGIIMLGGSIDDWRPLTPWQQLLFPVSAALMIIASGIGIDYITNPLGGVLQLKQWQWTLLTVQGIPYRFTLLADMFTLLWLLVASYTTKLLDGLDGLVPGVGTIGAIIVALVSFRPDVAQPETGVISLLFAVACAGFLLWNFSPARIYLGEGGSIYIGFMLGVLAIVSGGKIATALLILGLPMLDVAWVVLRRWFVEKRSPFQGDTLHLHFQFKQFGWTERQIVLFYYVVMIVFGLSTIWLHGLAKLLVLVGLGLFTLAVLSWLYYQVRQHD